MKLQEISELEIKHNANHILRLIRELKYHAYDRVKLEEIFGLVKQTKIIKP